MNAITDSTLPRFFETIKERGLTVKQVSEATGIPQTTISSWRKGTRNPKYDAVKSIAEYLNVSVDYLYGKEPLYDFRIEHANESDNTEFSGQTHFLKIENPQESFDDHLLLINKILHPNDSQALKMEKENTRFQQSLKMIREFEKLTERQQVEILAFMKIMQEQEEKANQE